MNAMISTSATATQQIADSFNQALAIRPLPEQFDGKVSKMYATGKSRRNYETLAVFTASTVARIYAAFDMLNYIVVNGAEFEDMLEVSPDDFVKRVKQNVELSAMRINIQLNDSKLSREIKSALAEHLSATQGAVIESSTRFPGGKDIILSGTPCPSSPLAAHGNFNVLNNQGSDRPRVDNDETFERQNLQTYSSDIAQAAIRVAKQLYKEIFGEARSNANVFSTKMVRVPLDKDWQMYNALLRSVHPSLHAVDIDLFRNLDKAVVDGLGDFMTIGLRPIPGKAMIDRKLQAMKISPDTPIEFNDVAIATDVRVEGGLIVNFEKEMVEYISQGADTQTMCLYRWFQGWASYYFRVAGSTRTGITRAARIPRYVTSATSLPELKKLREKFGYVVNDVVADENGLTIMPNGTMAVLPRREDIDVDMVKQYETSLNGVLEDLFAKGVPLSTEHDTLRTNLFAIQNGDLDFDRGIQEKAKSLSRFSNVCIGIDPDFALVVNTSNGGGLAVNETRTVGMKAPNSLDVADALGYDFAEPGEAPNFRSAANVIGNIHHNQASGGMAAFRVSNEMMVEAAKAESGSGRLVESVSESTIKYNSTEGSNLHYLVQIIAQTCQTYEFMLKNKQVPDLKTLVQNARVAIGMDADNATLAESPMDSGLYQNLIENDFSIPDIAAERPAMTMLRIMLRVLNDAAGLRGSNLVATTFSEMGSMQAAMESLPSHTHYFVMGESSKLSDMARLNNYFGGALYRELTQALARSDRKKLFSSLVESDTAPGSDRLQQIILPFATMYSDVIPKALEIFESAENEIERLKPDSGITIDDIRIPGLRPGAALLPHQVEAHKTLRRRPRYATIFIAPGGGKTIIGLSDVAALIKELDDLGEETIRPLIICPSNLVANWCDDLHKIVDGWNAVPITADTVNTWGEERMYDVIQQAPRNTIYIVGLSFLQTGTFNVDIGGVRVRVRGAVEFVNRFKFSYVLLDESHKVKNFSGGQAGSQVHFNTKAVFTAPSVRYARIATGTLVTDRVRDIVGQAALMTPAMFGDNLDVAYDGAKDDIEMIRRAHSRMANHTAFISFKRKHWAFMLPNPIDTFIQVEIDDPSVPNSSLHQEVYNAMYEQVLEKLQEAANAAKRKASSKDDDDEDAGADEGGAADDIDEDDIEEGDDLGALLAGNADLNMYFQRMEMMLTDPMGDDVARLTFEAAGVTSFVSAKVLTIIDRIKKHFEVQPERDRMIDEQQIFEWKPGVEPRELDIAVYNGQKYLARKQSEEFRRQTLPPSMVPPPEDPDYWKPEVQGKLIVFTRYVRSANAIYNALPENYKKVAVVYHGEVGKLGQNKDANLDAFKTDSNVQILIANEQAISEGHNMQMGSRIIRCDTPWSPGTYDQSTARIFRPDVAAAKLDENGKPGDMAREVVFIDWVMTNKTLEVGKVARLMWKTLEKTRFDEKGNQRYEELDEFKLDPIKMSAKLLIDNNTMADFIDYFRAKKKLNDIESQEFHEMRKTTVAAMQALPETPALRDFRVMEQTPFVANQKIPDRHGWGLERILDWARNRNFSNGENLKDSLNRMPVVTEYGNGIIVNVTARMVDGKLRADSPISTVRVRLAGTGETVSFPATKVHVATKVDKADLKKFFEQRKPWANDKDRKRADAEANRVEVEDTIQDETQTADSRETEKKVEAQERKTARVRKRAENKEKGKPINDGVEEAAKKVRRRKASELPKLGNTVKAAKKGSSVIALDDTGADMALNLTPTVYNGFVAIYADATDPDAKALKDFDFVQFGDYVYYDCMYYADFEAMLDFIEVKKKLAFDGPSEKRLEFVLDFFDESTPRMSFNSKLAVKTQDKLKQFFLIRHKSATDKKHVKAYPMVMEDRLRIMFDLATNPQMKRFIGTKIPNTRKFGTFDVAPGMWIGFVNNVAGAKARINKIVKAGYTITNLKRVVQALDKLKLTMSKNKSV